MDGIAQNIGLVLLFVLIGGYFSASELALVSLRQGQVSRLSSRSRRGARSPGCARTPTGSSPRFRSA